MALRLRALAARSRDGASTAPVVLETHGGAGLIFEEVYRPAGCTRGCVLEKDEDKVEVLARQRPTWSVYGGDSEKALAAGIGFHLPFDWIDVDPYGSPFETLAGIFTPGRPLADTVHLVVNDGLRQLVRTGGAWRAHCLKPIVATWGNDLYDDYLAVARELVTRTARAAGFAVTGWHGYHCGAQGGDMTHYHATLTRRAEQK